MQEDQRNRLIAGGVIVGLALAIGIGVIVSRHGSGNATCTLGASGVGLIADGLIKNKSAGVIVAEVTGAYGLSTGCKKAIGTLVNKPSDPVKFNIEKPNAGTVTKKTTGSDLGEAVPASPPPPPATTTSEPPIISCLGWESAVLYKLCLDGTLPPPR